MMADCARVLYTVSDQRYFGLGTPTKLQSCSEISYTIPTEVV